MHVTAQVVNQSIYQPKYKKFWIDLNRKKNHIFDSGRKHQSSFYLVHFIA